MDTFEDLMKAIESYSDAKAAYNKVKEGARSSYFYGGEEDAWNHAKKRLKAALEAHIKEVVLVSAGGRPIPASGLEGAQGAPGEEGMNGGVKQGVSGESHRLGR